MSSPAVLDRRDRPMSRPADSAVGMTVFAPDCLRMSVFWDSRTAATIVARGAIRRAVRVTRIDVSSSSVATTTRAARSMTASWSVSSRRPSPMTPTKPSRAAASMVARSGDTTTIWEAGVPASTRECAAARPFTPYPMITVWSFTWDLQRFERSCSRVRRVRTSIVVPTRTMRNTKRSGVMTRAFTRRADSQTGEMSP